MQNLEVKNSTLHQRIGYDEGCWALATAPCIFLSSKTEPLPRGPPKYRVHSPAPRRDLNNGRTRAPREIPMSRCACESLVRRQAEAVRLKREGSSARLHAEASSEMNEVVNLHT